MDKFEFKRRLERAGDRARLFAMKFVVDDLPVPLLYNVPLIDDPNGRRGPEGTIKFFGGRFLTPEELNLVSASRVSSLLWVDGRVPSWINVNSVGMDSTATHIGIECSGTLVLAEKAILELDWPPAVDENDPVAPFRIRGPRLPTGWRSVEESGRFSIEVRR